MDYEQLKIQRALKSLMKKRKITYQDIARTLKVSPATIKRRLNGLDISIRQLKELAEALSISFYELIELSKETHREPHLFTVEQEEFLASDINAIKIFRLILAGQTFSQIKSHFNGSEKILRSFARHLEKLGLAKLLPGDRFIAMVHFPFRWRTGGKLEKTYNKLILTNLTQRMVQDNGGAGINRKFEFALSEETYRAYCKDVEGVYLKYRNLSEIHLNVKVDMNHIVSGVFFIDQFSLWQSNYEQSPNKL